MFVVEISIESNENLISEEIIEMFYELVSALRMNGQIIGKEFVWFSTNTNIKYYLYVLEKDSLDKKYFNKYVEKLWSNLEEELNSKIQIKINGAENKINECCNNSKFFILYTDYVLLGSPLYCGECFNQIPLYKIPKTYDEEYHDIISWMGNYQACDILQMGCRVGEKFGYKEVSSIGSNLSKEGLEICKTIEKLTGKPTYYYLHHYSDRKKNRENCPICEAKWELEIKLHKFDYKCDNCRIISMKN